MTSDPYAKATPGEKLTIHATAWNKLIDTVKPNAAASPGEDFAYARSHFRVNCQNNSAAAIPQWAILKITDVLLGSSAAATGAWSWPGVVGEAPGSTGAHVVAVEPISVGAIGQAAVAGVVQVRVRVNCTGHQYAKPKTGEVNYLETSDSGPFRILWCGNNAPANPTGVSGPNNPWALVLFGTERPLDSLPAYSTGATQLLGHSKAASGASGCDTGLQWYSVSECAGTPSYATSYFL